MGNIWNYCAVDYRVTEEENMKLLYCWLQSYGVGKETQNKVWWICRRNLSGIWAITQRMCGPHRTENQISSIQCLTEWIPVCLSWVLVVCEHTAALFLIVQKKKKKHQKTTCISVHYFIYFLNSCLIHSKLWIKFSAFLCFLPFWSWISCHQSVYLSVLVFLCCFFTSLV